MLASDKEACVEDALDGLSQTSMQEFVFPFGIARRDLSKGLFDIGE